MMFNQVGRGEKRNHESDSESESEDEQGQRYFERDPKIQYHSEKFGMTATDHRVRFNNVIAHRDLLESIETTQKIFHYLLEEVTEGMNPNDQVRFILRSEQLDTPISLPFMSLEQLTTEKVYAQIEKVVQSNQDFRLNDTVTIDINHVAMPEGSGSSKRTLPDIRDHLKSTRSIVCINNFDDLCLARALVVGIANIENDPKYDQIKKSNRPVQRQRALDLHQAADVPLGPCGIPEVELFQNYLTNYRIVVVSGTHNNTIIYPTQKGGDNQKPILGLYYNNEHFDTLISIKGFLGRSYFCTRCLKGYDHTTDHMCPAMCRCCRAFDCEWDDTRKVCTECDRQFKNQACYDHHNQPINTGGRTVCQVIRKCPGCNKPMDIRKHRNGHICGKKCKTCGVVYKPEETEHLCYMQRLEQEDEEEESSYNQLLFFDFESIQEHGEHSPNLCIVHDEAGKEELFEGKDTVEKFCKWLFTKHHKDCIVIAHNFQGYDGYFIKDYLVKNAIKYEVIYRGAKSLSVKVPNWGIRFIDSLNFIPMALAKFPKTFGQDELCKGYFPHAFNKEENQNYIGPIPCKNDYGVDFMMPEQREAFIQWHDEQVANNYEFNFREEIQKYCRSDVDILRNCCLQYREMFRDITEIDPFNKSITIASYCLTVFRTKFLKKDTVATFDRQRYLKTMQSNTAVKWLSYIAEKENVHIQHVRNGGEKRVARYSLDGYCPQTSTAYEYQGCFWHGKNDVKKLYVCMEKDEKTMSFFFSRLSQMFS